MERLAAEGGVDFPRSCFSLTPRELANSFAAHRAQQERQDRDRWLLTRMIALAVHAPDRLPPPPSPSESRPMTAEAMKQRLLAWRGKDESP